MLLKVVSVAALLALPSCLRAATIIDDFEVGAISKTPTEMYTGFTQTGLSTTHVFGGVRRASTQSYTGGVDLTLSAGDDAMRFSTTANSLTWYTMSSVDSDTLNFNATAGGQNGIVFEVKSAPSAGLDLGFNVAELPLSPVKRRASGGVSVTGPGTYYIPFDTFVVLPGETPPDFGALDSMYTQVILRSRPDAYSVEISEIRIDVMPIPEPTALGFAGLAAIGLLARRRRAATNALIPTI